MTDLLALVDQLRGMSHAEMEKLSLSMSDDEWADLCRQLWDHKCPPRTNEEIENLRTQAAQLLSQG